MLLWYRGFIDAFVCAGDGNDDDDNDDDDVDANEDHGKNDDNNYAWILSVFVFRFSLELSQSSITFLHSALLSLLYNSEDWASHIIHVL